MLRPERKTNYFSVGEDLFVETPTLKGERRFTDSVGFIAAAPDALPAGSEPVFKFGRMFRRPNLPEYRPEKGGLIALGLAMRQVQDPGGNPNLPAGYTFLGQFIDHDLSFDTSQLSLEAVAPEDVASLRSPSLDLDSLYGLAPELAEQSETGKQIYEADGIRLKVGETQGDPVILLEAVFPNDLPRGDDPAKPQTATIIDPRNDENLATAQTHLAFIKFHNAVVEHLSSTVPRNKLFEAAREKVVQHYQWIVLRDFLPKIIETAVLDDVIRNGSHHFVFQRGENPFLPVEFSVAAFRLGHTLVTERYEWNRYFQSQPPDPEPAILPDLFTFTGFGDKNLLAQEHLLSSWIIDWTRFYDFTGFPGVKSNPHSNTARRIGPSIIPPLMNLPVMEDEADFMQSLSVRNLLRGRLLGLPAGQCVARRLGVKQLTPEEIADGPHREILQKYGFDKLTPLWYYILKESENVHHGERLGPVGSRLVAETFVSLIKASRVSILSREKPGEPIWEPDLGIKPKEFSMPDLLLFVHRTFEKENYINPLGDRYEAENSVVAQKKIARTT
jgi:hypothetical protein